MTTDLTESGEKHVVDNSWRDLRQFTDARIALGRAGSSIPTSALLAFQMDHANARDAVHIPLDREKLSAELPREYGQLSLHSQAINRESYLQRPDLGRRLAKESVERLQAYKAENQEPVTVALVVVDGLSSTAVQQQAAKMTKLLCQKFAARQDALAPICLVEQGRVAIGDEIGELLGVDCLVLMIGERPGLSSPDSLGIYYTFKPKVGLQDSNRNCISNIRPRGLPFEEACDKLLWLIDESRRIQQSGVMLKDGSDNDGQSAVGSSEQGIFLLPD